MIAHSDDDWDDRGSIEDKRPVGILTTRRIVAALAVLVVVVVVTAKVVNRQPMGLRDVPPSLIGLWTCDDQEKSDHFVEFQLQSIRLGTGGTSDVKFEVLGLNAETIGEVGHFTLYYRDLAGNRHEMEMLLDETGEELRFMDHPGAVWTRFRR
jgi:hypothetical protein